MCLTVCMFVFEEEKVQRCVPICRAQQELIYPTKGTCASVKSLAFGSDSTSVNWLSNSTLAAQSWDWNSIRSVEKGVWTVCFKRGFWVVGVYLSYCQVLMQHWTCIKLNIIWPGDTLNNYNIHESLQCFLSLQHNCCSCYEIPRHCCLLVLQQNWVAESNNCRNNFNRF